MTDDVDAGGASHSQSAAVRAATVLYVLSDSSSGTSVRTVAAEIGASRSAVHRILQAFVDEGFAVQNTEGRYSAGPRLLQLGARALSGSTILTVAEPVMIDLVRTVRETAYLAVYVKAESRATFVHRIECDNPLRFVQPLGARILLTAGAVGKAILAVLPDDERQALISASGLSTKKARDLEKDLAAIRKRGYSTSVEERVKGAAGVASPVYAGQQVVGALTVTVPTARIPSAGLESLGGTVRTHAERISALTPPLPLPVA